MSASADTGLGEDRLALRDTVRAFARTQLAAAVAPDGSGNGHLSRETFTELAGRTHELGLTAMLIPEEYGGGGGAVLDAAIALEELGAVDAGFAAGLGLTMTVPSFVLAAGTTEQRARLLPPLARDPEFVLAGALNEPSVAGSELFDPRPASDRGIATRARADGDGYVVDGAKAPWVTNAGVAKAYIVFARTDPDRPAISGTSAFWVPAGTPGLSVGPRTRLLGLHGGWHADVVLHDVRVAQDALIGPPGDGLGLLQSTTPGMAVGLAAVFVGVAQAALDASLAHTSARHSWGAQLRSHQAVALELADMTVAVRASRLMVRDAARAVDRGAPPGELALSVPAAKVHAVETAIANAQRAVRLHGATGVAVGAGPEKLLRDAWTGYSCDFTGAMLRLAMSEALPSP